MYLRFGKASWIGAKKSAKDLWTITIEAWESFKVYLISAGGWIVPLIYVNLLICFFRVSIEWNELINIY